MLVTRNLVSNGHFNKKQKLWNRHLHDEIVVKENNIKRTNIDLDRSEVRQRVDKGVDGGHKVKWITTSFKEFFDCECENKKILEGGK